MKGLRGRLPWSKTYGLAGKKGIFLDTDKGEEENIQSWVEWQQNGTRSGEPYSGDHECLTKEWEFQGGEVWLAIIQEAKPECHMLFLVYGLIESSEI